MTQFYIGISQFTKKLSEMVKKILNKNIFIIEACYSFSFNIGWQWVFFTEYQPNLNFFSTGFLWPIRGARWPYSRTFSYWPAARQFPRDFPPSFSNVLKRISITISPFDVFGKGVAMLCTEYFKHTCIFPEMKLEGLVTNFYIHVYGSVL